MIKNGLRWRDAPGDYGPHKTIYNRFVRWSRLGVFNKIFAELARKGGKPERIMIDATHLKAHRTAASLLKKGLFPDVSAHQRRPELQAARVVTARPPARDAVKRGQMSDYKGAALMLPALPNKPGSFSPTRATTPMAARRARKARDRRLHPLEIQSKGRDPL